MVDHATTTQTTKNNQIRILGTDPTTGHTVKARIGRYGPMVEIKGNEGEKSRFASLKKGQLIESLTLEEALALFSLPRNLGPYEGEDLVIGIGKFGPYVRHGKSFASLARTDDPIRSATTALRSSCANSRPTPLQRTLRSKPSPKSPNY